MQNSIATTKKRQSIKRKRCLNKNNAHDTLEKVNKPLIIG